MKKMNLKVLAGLVFGASLLSISAVEARTLYWTGRSAAYDYNECRENAYYNGLAGARRSCAVDYKIRYSVCENADVERVEDLGSYFDRSTGTYQCTTRVYIYVP